MGVTGSRMRRGIWHYVRDDGRSIEYRAERVGVDFVIPPLMNNEQSYQNIFCR